MKEATGEANMTVVTIILIAAIVAVGTPIIKGMVQGTQDKADCYNKGCLYQNGKCVYDNGAAC